MLRNRGRGGGVVLDYFRAPSPPFSSSSKDGIVETLLAEQIELASGPLLAWYRYDLGQDA